MYSRINYREFNFDEAREILGGKNLVFTGRGFAVRGELSLLASKAGALVERTVTRKTDILVVGEKPGSKLSRAKSLGCEIISVDDFKDILRGIKVGGIYEIDPKMDFLNI
jgi:NAD-dependent DNA ligase